MNLKVIRVDYKLAKKVIMENHYSRRMPCIQFAFGLLDTEKGEILGVVSYGQPASPNLCRGVAGDENRMRVLELNRLVIFPTAPKNSASFLVGHSLKMLPRKMVIVSYADCGDWGHVGYVYQATNFFYTGATKARTDIFSPSGHSRHHCGDKTKRQPRSAKHRYVTFTGTKMDKKALRNCLKYPVLEYPKGETHRYDTANPIKFSER